MDSDGFLLQMRIELDGVERVAAPLWALAVPVATYEAPGGNGASAIIVSSEAEHELADPLKARAGLESCRPG